MQCPDENTLVAFTHRLLEADERTRVEGHLRDCSECRQVIALLAEAQPPPGVEASSEVAPSTGSGEPLPALPERMLSPGMHLGRYILLRPLGVGGMGVVYAAYGMSAIGASAGPALVVIPVLLAGAIVAAVLALLPHRRKLLA